MSKLALRKEYMLILLGILALIVKLYLVYDIPIWARPGSARDDLLMIKMADNIAHGDWLGHYDEFTFIKGVTYPIFLAIGYVLQIPVNITHTLLYVISVCIFIYAIKPVVTSNKYLLLAYLIMIFSPIAFATNTFQIIYRDDIYYSLILIIVSCYIAIFFRNKDFAQCKSWMLLTCIDFIAVMFCREDSIWIVPFILLAAYCICRHSNFQMRNKLLIVTAPFLAFLLSCIFLGSINYVVYGKFTINEFQYSSFTRAYGVLTQVKADNVHTKVKLTNEAMDKIYNVSPSFRELKEAYDGDVGNLWRGASKEWNHADGVPDDQIAASHSMWAFRNAVASLGYYESPQKADEYYERVIKEVDEAFDNGTLEKKHSFNVPLFSMISLEDAKKLPYEIFKTAKYVIDEEKLTCSVELEEVNGAHVDGDIAEFEKITRQFAIGAKRSRVSGWIASKNNDVQAFIVNKQLGKNIPFKESEDVHAYFKNEEKNYYNTQKCRFDISDSEDISSKYEIILRNTAGDVIDTININHAGRIENDNVIVYIEAYIHAEQEYDKSIMQHKVDMLNMVSHIYALCNKYLLVGLTLALMVLMFSRTHKLKFVYIYVLVSLWVVFLLRIFVISFNSITAFNSLGYPYLSPCYPIMAAIVSVSLIGIFDLEKRKGALS